MNRLKHPSVTVLPQWAVYHPMPYNIFCNFFSFSVESMGKMRSVICICYWNPASSSKAGWYYTTTQEKTPHPICSVISANVKGHYHQKSPFIFSMNEYFDFSCAIFPTSHKRDSHLWCHIGARCSSYLPNMWVSPTGEYRVHESHLSGLTDEHTPCTSVMMDKVHHGASEPW